MRNPVLLATALLGGLALVACGGATTPPDVTAPDVTATASPATSGDRDVDEDASQTPPAVPALRVLRQREEPDERHPSYALDLDRPSVDGVAPEVAERIDAALAAFVDERVRVFVADDAEFDHEAAMELPPGELDLDVTTGARNPHLLSVLFTELAMHQGAAHPWTTLHGTTFDLATGAPVALADLFEEDDDTVHAVVSEAAVEILVARLDPQGEGWARDMVTEGAGPDAASLGRFVVEREGLVVHFDQYQVAPGVAGPQQVTLAWAELRRSLTPQGPLEAALAALG